MTPREIKPGTIFPSRLSEKLIYRIIAVTDKSVKVRLNRSRGPSATFSRAEVEKRLEEK